MKQTLQDDINTKASNTDLQNYVEKTALKPQFDAMKQTLQDDINTKASNTEVQSLRVSWFSNNTRIQVYVKALFGSLPSTFAIFYSLCRILNIWAWPAWAYGIPLWLINY